jgi:hypothetical protein
VTLVVGCPGGPLALELLAGVDDGSGERGNGHGQ